MTNDRDAPMDRPMNCIATFVAEDGEVTRVEMFTRGAHEETERCYERSVVRLSVRTISAPRDERINLYFLQKIFFL